MDNEQNPELRFSAFRDKQPKPASAKAADQAGQPGLYPGSQPAHPAQYQPQVGNEGESQTHYPGHYYPATLENDEFSLVELLGILFHRKYWFIASILAVAVLGFFTRIHLQPTYAGTTKLRVVEYTGEFDLLKKLNGVSSTVLSTHLENLKSYHLLKNVVKALDTNISIKQLSGLYSVSNMKNTNIIIVRTETTDPAFSSRLANTIAQTYEKYDLSLKQKSFISYERWILTQMKKKKQLLQDIEMKVRDFYEHNPTFYDEGKMAVSDHEKRLAEIKMERREIEEQVSLIAKEMDGLDSQMLKEITYDKPLQKELLQLKLEKAKLSSQYADNHRVIRQIDTKIQAIRNLMANESEDDASTTIMVSNPRYAELLSSLHDANTKMSILTTRENEIVKALDKSYKLFKAAPEVEMKFQQLVRERGIQQNMVSTLESKLQEAQLQKSATPREIFLIEKAIGMGSKIPTRQLGFLTSLLIGLALGIGVCFLLEYFDSTVKKSKDLQNKFGLELLGIVPHSDIRKIDRNLRFKFGSKESEIEPYRRLLANLASLERQQRISGKSLLVTSALQSEGKTTTAAFLSSTAAFEGRKVLLIDADLRRSGIHPIFGMSNHLGLSEYLTEQQDWHHFIQPSPVTNLDIISSGQSIVSFTKIGTKDKFQALVAKAKKEYDLVVVDSPPILKVSDTLVVAPLIDATLLVFRSEKTPFKAVEELLRQLNFINANIAGGIINDISKSFWDKYYYNYYNYYQYEYYS